MSFTVYHISSTQQIKTFNSESSAKRSTTCMNRNAGKIAYAYAETSEYRKNVVTKKKVRNLMSGQEVEIDSNTPLCCDPSSETYWSM